MRVLLDHCTPARLRRHLAPHSVNTAYRLGWHQLTNGKLLHAAEQGGYDVFITADQNMQYQQRVSDRRIAIIVLTNGNWPAIEANLPKLVAVVDRCKPGDFHVVAMDDSSASVPAL